MLKNMYECTAIRTIIDDAKNIVIEVRSHYSLLGKYRELAHSDYETKITELSLYSKTRFGGTVLMMHSLFHGLKILRAMDSDSKIALSEPTKKKLLSFEPYQKFTENLEQCLSLLKPINDCVHTIESDSKTLADMINI